MNYQATLSRTETLIFDHITLTRIETLEFEVEDAEDRQEACKRAEAQALQGFKLEDLDWDGGKATFMGSCEHCHHFIFDDEPSYVDDMYGYRICGTCLESAEANLELCRERAK